LRLRGADARRRGQLDLGGAVVHLDQPSDAHGSPVVPDFGPAKSCPVFAPDHDGEPSGVRVPCSEIQECWLAVARAREVRVDDGPSHRDHPPDVLAGGVPADRASARQRALTQCGAGGGSGREKECRDQPDQDRTLAHDSPIGGSQIGNIPDLRDGMRGGRSRGALGQDLVALGGEGAGECLARCRADRNVDRHSAESRIGDRPPRHAGRRRVQPWARSEPDHFARVDADAAREGLLARGRRLRERGTCGDRTMVVLPREVVVSPRRKSHSNRGGEGEWGNPAPDETSVSTWSDTSRLRVGTGGGIVATPRTACRRGVRAAAGRTAVLRKQLPPGLARHIAVPVAVFERHPLNLNSCRWQR
jgi:hypothetical protein